MADATSTIQLKDVDKVYSNGFDVQVLYDIDLEIEQGSFNSLVGQSGSGKSTLLNIIGTLDKPTRGEVWITGKRTDSMSKNQLAALRNETIGFIFQAHYLLPEYTARENVIMPWLIRISRARDEALNSTGRLTSWKSTTTANNPRPITARVDPKVVCIR